MKRMILRQKFFSVNFLGFMLCCFPAIAQDNQPEPASFNPQKIIQHFYSPLIPRTYLVDRRGHLRHAWIGSETIDSVENKIHELLFD